MNLIYLKLVQIADGLVRFAVRAVMRTTNGGPIGSAICGTIGNFAGSMGAHYLSDRLTQELFGIPREVELENAYNFFGLNRTSSTSEIKTVYRKFCKKYHPDKGGSNDEFVKGQVNHAVIRAARGDL